VLFSLALSFTPGPGYLLFEGKNLDADLRRYDEDCGAIGDRALLCHCDDKIVMLQSSHPVVHSVPAGGNVI